MKGRFPPDLLVVVFGPFLVVAIALGFGSLFFHIHQLRGTATGFIVPFALLACLVAALVVRMRRR